MLWKSSKGRLENVLGTPRINLSGASLERQIRTSPGRHFRMSTRHQIWTSPGWANRIFRGCPGDVGDGCPQDVLGTNVCRVGIIECLILFRIIATSLTGAPRIIIRNGKELSWWFTARYNSPIVQIIAFLIIANYN